MVVVEVGVHDHVDVVGGQTLTLQRVQHVRVAAHRGAVGPGTAVMKVVLMDGRPRCPPARSGPSPACKPPLDLQVHCHCLKDDAAARQSGGALVVTRAMAASRLDAVARPSAIRSSQF